MTIKETLMMNIDDIKSRYANGESLNSIANSYGVNSGNLHFLLKDLKLLRLDGSKNYGKSEEFLPKIKELLDLGYSAYKIGNEIGLSKPVVLKTMKKHGLSTSHLSKQREIPLSTNEDEIIRLYIEDKLSANQIAIKYNAAVGNILKILNNVNINTEKVFYSFDETYFDNIDNIGKAWFLGLMYTDGNNRGDDCIRLQMADLDIIEKAKSLIQYSGPILEHQPKQEHYKRQYLLGISRKGISDKLTNLGCMPNKTMSLQYPNDKILPLNLSNHFIRGALDGDGSITKTMLNFTGTIPLLKGIEESVYTNLGIKFNWYNRYPEKGEDYPIRMIALTKRQTILSCMKWIYKDSEECNRGNRKYERALSYGLGY